MPVLKKYINPTYDEFKKLLNTHYNDMNINNEEHFLEMFSFVYSNEIKGVCGFKLECQKFFKQKRNGKAVSKLSTSYWNSRGYDNEYATLKISELQRKNSNVCNSHWTDKGYNQIEATLMVANEQSRRSNLRYTKYDKHEISRQSVWSIEYWKNIGFSEEEAKYEAHKRNYGCREFWSSESEYDTIKAIISKKQSNFIKNNPEKFASFFGSVSKEEVVFFNNIVKSIDNIKHTEFIVNIQKSEELNQGIIKYDGYFKDEDSLILIEYDGLYWHNQIYDEIKDRICLEFRNDITGIIRVSDNSYKNNTKTIKLIKDAIKQIKNKECNRVKIY
jgi:hypothetical protein